MTEPDRDVVPWIAPQGWEAVALVLGSALLAWSEVSRGVLAFVLGRADLVFHEAGHVVVGVLGVRFLTILGGTLGQLAFPLVAGVAFAARRRATAYAAMAVWLGVNLVDVGIYAADGQARELPLLVPDKGAHDWWNMLGMLGVREHAPVIGGAIQLAGWALQGIAPGWAVALWAAARG